MQLHGRRRRPLAAIVAVLSGCSATPSTAPIAEQPTGAGLVPADEGVRAGQETSSGDAAADAVPDVAGLAASWRFGPGTALAAQLSEDGHLVVVTTIGIFVTDEAGVASELVRFDASVDASLAVIVPDGSRVVVGIEGPAPVRVYSMLDGSSSEPPVPAGTQMRTVLTSGPDLVVDTAMGPVAVGGATAIDPLVAAGPSALLPDGRIVTPRIDTATLDVVTPTGTTTTALQLAAGEQVRDAKVSPDGTLVAASVGDPDATPPADRIIVFDAETLAMVSSVDVGGGFQPVEWTLTDAGPVVVAGGTMRAFARDGGPRGVWSSDERVAPAVGVEAIGSTAVAVRRDGAITRWDGTGEPVVVAGGGVSIRSWGLGPADAARVATVDAEGRVVIRSLVDGAPIVDTTDYALGVPTSISVGRDSTIAVSTDLGGVRLLDTRGSLRTTLPLAGDGRLGAVALGPGGEVAVGVAERLGDGAFDDSVSVWDPGAISPAFVLPAGGESVAGCSVFFARVAISADGTSMAVASHDFAALIVDVATGAVRAALPGSSTIVDLDYMDDDRLLVASREDGMVDVWRTGDLSLVASYRPPVGRFDALEWVPGTTSMAVTDINGALSVVGISDGAPVLAVEGSSVPLPPFDVSSDGALAAAPRADGTIGVWSLRTGEQIGTATGHLGEITGVAFAADGRSLVTSSVDGTVRGWELPAGG